MSIQLPDLENLSRAIKAWGRELGFADVRIADVDLADQEAGLQAWLDAGHHGDMDYMASHGMKRARPAELVPGTVRVISARMDYLPMETKADWRARERLRQDDPQAAVVSIYARGRDYHKVLRNRLQALADKVKVAVGEYGYRVFTDSAPVMELPLAQKAGIGWRGKHTLLLSRTAGSTFFIGEILVDLPLPVDAPTGALPRPTDRLRSKRSCPKRGFSLPSRRRWNSSSLHTNSSTRPAVPRPFRSSKSGTVERWANLFHGHTSWQSSQP